MKYEKDGFTWLKKERLQDLIKSDRIEEVKLEHTKRTALYSGNASSKLLDILELDEEEGCAACFI